MAPLVTISIPIYNCEDFLVKCLESVLMQEYSPVEVILVNDCTPDNSVVLAERFIQEHELEGSWKILHLQKNGGLSVVRNAGIDAAAGHYLFFLDSDDEIMPYCISEMVSKAKEHDAQMTVGEVEGIILETGQITDVFPLRVEEDVLRGNKIIFKKFVEGEYPESSWNKLYRIDFLREHKLYFTPGLFAQDSLQSFQTALKLESVAFVRRKTYRYYLHQNSVIHNRNSRHFDNWISIAKEINRSYHDEQDQDKKRLIKIFLMHFKNNTLVMNWKAQKNEKLWKKSYIAYAKLQGLTIGDMVNREIPFVLKKQQLFNTLPSNLGFRLFKWRYNR